MLLFPPPQCYYFPFSSSSFLLFPSKRAKGQNQAYKAKLKCDGLILAFSRENNRNEEEEEEEEGKQQKWGGGGGKTIKMRRRRRRENNRNEEEEEEEGK